MQNTFEFLRNFAFTDNLDQNVESILSHFSKEETYHHVSAVAKKASEIAEHFDVDKQKIHRAAMLHDISAIFPNGQRLKVAEELGVEEIKPDDIANLIMLHGKISAKLAEKYFGISDTETLDAMKYYTALRGSASLVEQVVFIADKIELDPTTLHKAEYMDAVVRVVDTDVTKACWYYLDWMFENLKDLGWQKHYNAVAAYGWLSSIYEKND